jgi:hypothetical protein
VFVSLAPSAADRNYKTLPIPRKVSKQFSPLPVFKEKDLSAWGKIQ